MYDLTNLNDYEFEALCRDIMEIKLGRALRLFTRGRDGGVDVTTYTVGNEIIIQVKHYIKSNYSNLLSTVKKEVAKLDKKQKGLKEYYICTSMTLSPPNVDELFSICSGYMETTANIIDGTEINTFLEKEENIEIVKKHYKLWLAASNVLGLVNNKNVFIDCDDLVNEISNETKIYVETKAYYNAVRALEKKNILVILGLPGIGKSTLSKMLLFHYLSMGYVVRYSSDNNIDDIKRLIGSENTKEVILLDDFLGQHYLNIKDNQSNGIKSLVSTIKRDPNKKLIMNSRITIYNEAKRINYKFEKLVDDHEDSIFYLNIDDITKLDKAKIFYNHIFFNELPDEYYQEIVRNRNYRRIINHPNYNPRIIEFVSQKRNYSSIPPSHYYDYIVNNLSNPQMVWKDEFVNRITNVDRIFLFTLYSLGNSWSEQQKVKEAFNARLIFEKGVDTTVNQYQLALCRLTVSMIKIGSNYFDELISVINPSVNDFLFSELNNNPSECNAIINRALYLEQIIQINYNDRAIDIVKKSICEGLIFKLKILDDFSYTYIIKAIIRYNILEENIKDNVVQLMKWYCNYKPDNTNRNVHATLWYDVLESKLMDFYDIESLLCDNQVFHSIISNLSTENAEKLLNHIIAKCKDSQYFNAIINNINEVAADVINMNILDEYSEYMLEVISDEFNYAMEEIGECKEEDMVVFLGCYFEKRAEAIMNEEKAMLEDRSTFRHHIINPIDINSIINEMEIEGLVENYMEREPDYDYDDDRGDYGTYKGNDDEIDVMFS